jgi:mRNA interferase RelE/StbE
MYELIYSTEAQKDLERLPKDIALRVHKSLKKIKQNPYNYVKKLEGSFGIPLYSYKVGREYRCIITVEDNRMVVFVIEVGHRKNIYRKY